MEFLDFDAINLLALSFSLGKLWNGFTVLLGLGLVIFFHELGHFAVAKWCDVHVERFSIGIGPIIWSRQKGETEYALSALPFGGYVKMLGQDDMDSSQQTSDEIAENPRSYTSKKVWQRMAIISAGVIMNVITGFMFFAIAYRMGVTEIVPMVGNVGTGMPAWEAGLKPGDIIREIDGSTINNWRDMNLEVALSSGPISALVERRDGTKETVKILPRVRGIRPMIGVASASETQFIRIPPEDYPLVSPGSAASFASEEFQWGDDVVAVNGQDVTYSYEVQEIEAREADRDLVYSVERMPLDDEGKPVEGATPQKLEISVPPQRTRTPGFMMAMGPVSAIQPGSPGSEVFEPGDLLVSVDGQEVSRDIDPLALPGYFSAKAGEEVVVVVKRQTSEEGREEKEVRLTPADIPVLRDPLRTATGPLPIPSIGVGVHVQPRIAFVSEEAGTNYEGKLQANQKITKIEFVQKDPENLVADALGEEAVETIDIEEVENDEAETGKPNWAVVHAAIQAAPNRDVFIYVTGGSEGAAAEKIQLTDIKAVDGWYLPYRGINGWKQLTQVRKVSSLAEAASLGIHFTRNNGLKIYMTLVSLFRGSLSVKALSGPLGIIQAGTQEADDGLASLFVFLGFLSVNLAVLNFLPIPVLDGGHMVFLIWEAVARKKPSPRIINLAHGLGLVFLLSLFVFVLSMDFMRLTR